MVRSFSVPVSKEFVNRMCLLLDAPDRKDVLFLVGENSEIFKGHHLVLATVSPYLADNTVSDTSSEAVLVLEDIDPNIFNGVLRYIYTGQILLCSIIDAVCVAYVAHKFMMSELWHQCLHFIKMLLGRKLIHSVRKQAAARVRSPQLFPVHIRYSTRNLMRRLQNIEEDIAYPSEEHDTSKGAKRKRSDLSEPLALLDYISFCILECRSNNLPVTCNNLRVILAILDASDACLS